MTAASLVAELRARGVTLIPDGNLLRCRPKSALPEADLAALRDRKRLILSYLRAEEDKVKGKVRCYACRSGRFWRTVYGEIICHRCHPAADEALVAGWIGPVPEGEGHA